MINLKKLKTLPNRLLRFSCLLFFAAILGVSLSTILGEDINAAMPMAAGQTTVFNRTSSAYEQPSAGLNSEDFDRHAEGDAAFEAVFVTAPAKVNPGLGPLFNNSSCVGCHIRNGRGLPKKGQLLARVSQTEAKQISDSLINYHLEESIDIDNAPSVPGLGTQIQDLGVYGHAPEASVEIEWLKKNVNYGDGSSFSLRYPEAKITLPNNKALAKDVQVSLRIPSPVFGLGLLEAVKEEDILALADVEDKNQDSISGKPNQVWDVANKAIALGRFGWKANQPNLIQQTASAYVNDMGITNPLFPEKDGSMDIDRKTLEDAAFYAQTLSVPARDLMDDTQVKRGEKLFTQANCTGCHLPQLRTGDYFVKPLANQTIHPYTDLLLHDLGEGLADNRPDFQASGREWRTAPLWGIGLTQTVLPYSSYLHDGRAKTLEEAILWHGGEAELSKESFRKMNQSDRNSLVRFLKTL